MSPFALELSDAIEREYTKQEHDLGWRLLSSPCDVLDDASLAFIGLNPGGSERPDGHAEIAMPSGSAYVSESWAGHPPGGSPLQQQVRALFKLLEVQPESVLAGNLIPFRSRDWASLRNKGAALLFGSALWTRILRRAAPSRVIVMGDDVFKQIKTVMGAGSEKRYPLGWGRVTAKRVEYHDRVLIGLPHLSRFRIVTRVESQRGLRTALGIIA